MSFTHLIPACLYFRLNLFCSKLRISIRIYIIGGIECVYIFKVPSNHQQHHCNAGKLSPLTNILQQINIGTHTLVLWLLGNSIWVMCFFIYTVQTVCYIPFILHPLPKKTLCIFIFFCMFFLSHFNYKDSGNKVGLCDIPVKYPCPYWNWCAHKFYKNTHT